MCCVPSLSSFMYLAHSTIIPLSTYVPKPRVHPFIDTFPPDFSLVEIHECEKRKSSWFSGLNILFSCVNESVSKLGAITLGSI